MAKVILLDSPSWRLFNPTMHCHLGILYLAGSLRAGGHDVKVMDCHKVTGWDGENLILHKELMEECDVLGVSATTANVNWGGEMAIPWPAKIKILGGTHVTHIMEGPHDKFKQAKFFKGFDYVMFGECEQSFVIFCDRVDEWLNSNGILLRDNDGIVREMDSHSSHSRPNFTGVPGLVDFTNPISLWNHAPVQPDVTKLPAPAFDLWDGGFAAGALSSPSTHGKQFDASQLMTASLYTARGCPYGCTFCADARTKLREEGLDQIESQVNQLAKMGVGAIRIQDDTFTIRENRCRAIADILHNYGMKWRATTRVNLKNPDLFSYMQKAGCTELGFGIEHGSARMLKAMAKGTTPEANELGLAMCRDSGMFARAFLMLGFPGETEESIQELEDWVLTVHPDAVTLSLFQPFPGSDVWNHPERYNVVLPDAAFDKFWQLGGDGDPEMLILRLPTISKERLFHHRQRLVSVFEEHIGHLDRTRLHGNVGTFASEAMQHV